jgi:RNA polymerase sigma-32 factor
MAYIDDPETQRANLSFIKSSMATPLLSREREFELAAAWRERSDIAALHELVAAYTRLVIARAFAITGCRSAIWCRKARSA